MASLKQQKLVRIIILDLVMIFVLMVNLIWIVIDAFYAMEFIQALLVKHLPYVYDFYKPIHLDFWRYDLIFVAFFVTEILIQWAVAIYKHTYHRWFFYPFIHWYDVLGSIPVGGFRWLRVLRVISIVFRLQKLQIIDITKNYLFKSVNKYVNVLVEEISDRVVVNVLEGVQAEARSGTPVVTRIIDEVIRPQKQFIVELVTEKIGSVTSKTNEIYSNELQEYVDSKVSRAIELNADVALMKKLPIVGETISSTLEKAVSDVVFRVVDGILTDLSSKKSDDKLHEVTGTFFDQLIDIQYLKDNHVIEKILIDSIDIIKDQVNVQQWKVLDLEEREQVLMKKLEQNPNKATERKLDQIRRLKEEARIATPLFKINPELDFDD